MMHDEDRDFDQLARTLREIDTPPPAPREALWARIQAERAARRNGMSQQPGTDTPAPQDGVVLLTPRRRRTVWLQWGAALAATLVVGIGLGRVTLQQATSSQPAPDAAATTSPGTDTGAGAGPYRLAATQHLQRTEALLASLGMDARTDGTGDVSSWAGELLTDTRLLLSSPAADDAETRRLLEDLELVLAQIAAIPAARAEQEVELIQDGLNQSDVLLRLRAATAVRRTVGT